MLCFSLGAVAASFRPRRRETERERERQFLSVSVGERNDDAVCAASGESRRPSFCEFCRHGPAWVATFAANLMQIKRERNTTNVCVCGFSGLCEGEMIRCCVCRCCSERNELASGIRRTARIPHNERGGGSSCGNSATALLGPRETNEQVQQTTITTTNVSSRSLTTQINLEYQSWPNSDEQNSGCTFYLLMIKVEKEQQQ